MITIDSLADSLYARTHACLTYPVISPGFRCVTASRTINLPEASALQEELRWRVVKRDDLGPAQRVAGTDCAFKDWGRIIRAAVAVLSYPELKLLEHSESRHVPAVRRSRRLRRELGATRLLTDSRFIESGLVRVTTDVPPRTRVSPRAFVRSPAPLPPLLGVADC